MSNNQNNQNEVSNQAIAMIGMAIGIGLFAKNIDRFENWVRMHWFSLAVMGVGLIYGIVKFMQWRWKMKNPEAYERELAIKQMNQTKRRDDSFFQ